MAHAQRLLTGLLVMFLAGGLFFVAVGRTGLTGAAVTGAPAVSGKYHQGTGEDSGIFCYRSVFCQSGIECLSRGQDEPFCSQPAAFDGEIGQRFGEPCVMGTEGQIRCPLAHRDLFFDRPRR